MAHHRASGRVGGRLSELVQLLMVEKTTLRAKLRGELAGLNAGTVRAHSAAVWERLAQVSEFTAAKCVCAYVSTGREIETHGLIRQLLAIGRQVCVPTFVGEYVPAEIEDFDTDLAVGKFGILEPKAVRPARPDVWLVPGLGFDQLGNRLGRGQGYYDALLRRAPGIKIALAHDFQVTVSLPTETHDIRLDFIITEKQVVHCQKES